MERKKKNLSLRLILAGFIIMVMIAIFWNTIETQAEETPESYDDDIVAVLRILAWGIEIAEIQVSFVGISLTLGGTAVRISETRAP